MNSRLLRTVLGVIASFALLMLASPVVAQTEDAEDQTTASETLADSIQILSTTTTDDGLAELTVAIPPSIGQVDPIQSDFALTLGGNRRAVIVEELNDEVDVVLVIDTSGSMRGAPLAAAKDAAIRFVEEIPESSRVAVIGFGATPTLASELSLDRQSSRAAIGSLRARGETALWDALVAAGDLIREEGRSAPYLLVLSDGGDTASQQTMADSVRSLTLDENPVGLYAVTLETPESDHSALNTAASRPGGQVLNTEETAALEELYSEIAGRLKSRYQVRFVPDGSGDVVLSVAADGSIATATTTYGVAVAAGDIQNETTNALPDLGEFAPELGVVEASELQFFESRQMLWIGAGAAFIGLLFLFSTIAIPAMKTQPMAAVRSADPSARVSVLNDRVSGAADRFIRKRDDTGTVDKNLDAAGIDMRAGEFVVALGVVMISIGAVASVIWGIWAGVAGIVLSGLAAVMAVRAKMSKRRNAFANQLENTITILTGSLRAGRGLPQALEMVSLEAPDPTAEEFRRVIVEIRVGRDPVAALDAVAERMASTDLEWINQAISVNRELGGDLIELLENVARTIRDRNRIRLQVRSLSAEGRVSGWVMLALPVLMYGYMRAVNADYVNLLHTTGQGIILSIVGFAALAAGGLWIRKLVNIRF